MVTLPTNIGWKRELTSIYHLKFMKLMIMKMEQAKFFAKAIKIKKS